MHTVTTVKICVKGTKKRSHRCDAGSAMFDDVGKYTRQQGCWLTQDGAVMWDEYPSPFGMVMEL